mmetsp:Transcript_72895/g.189782  ORF Transcript_72895/g.189782 Transcript_72895/m.189782 type:complete len:230 (-) Transcript_72895:511-1200(-)
MVVKVFLIWISFSLVCTVRVARSASRAARPCNFCPSSTSLRSTASIFSCTCSETFWSAFVLAADNSSSNFCRDSFISFSRASNFRSRSFAHFRTARSWFSRVAFNLPNSVSCVTTAESRVPKRASRSSKVEVRCCMSTSCDRISSSLVSSPSRRSSRSWATCPRSSAICQSDDAEALAKLACTLALSKSALACFTCNSCLLRMSSKCERSVWICCFAASNSAFSRAICI